MNYNYISNCLNMCDEHINEGGFKITSIVLVSFVLLPSNIKKLIIEDYKLVRKIIDFYYNDFLYRSNKYNKLEDALSSIKFIINKTNDKKTNIIRFNDELFPWLLETEFFNNIYENNCPNIVDPNAKPKPDPNSDPNSDPKSNSSTFTPELSWTRPNQKESIEISLKNNFLSGIDLHATGGGKTFIILAKAYYYNQLFNKNILLICEKKYILCNEFANLELINKNIIDTQKINIINVTTDSKNKHFYEKITGTNNLIIVNRSAISHANRYKQINKTHNIGLILIDECHSSSANKTFEILEYFKSLNANIIGFSATPIRGNKLSKYAK